MPVLPGWSTIKYKVSGDVATLHHMIIVALSCIDDVVDRDLQFEVNTKLQVKLLLKGGLKSTCCLCMSLKCGVG